MQRTALTLLGALLISGLAVQLAAASEHHHRSKAYFGRYLPEYRGTYNQVDGPINVTPRVFDRFDPSVPHDDKVQLAKDATLVLASDCPGFPDRRPISQCR